MKAADNLSHEAFAKGWKDKTIGISVMDGYAEKILFMVVAGPSRIGWKAAKWIHRSLGIATIILAYKFSWLWLFALMPMLFVRRAWYEEARKEIGHQCAQNDKIFTFVRNSGLVIFITRT